MHIDDFILCLTKMGYKKGEAITGEHGWITMKHPPGEKSYITYQDKNSEPEEWGIDIKTEHSWKHSGHSPLVNFYCRNGSVESYIYLDSQVEEQFLMPTKAEHIESIGDLCYLLEHKFRNAIDYFVRCHHAKN